jgi:transcriptional regulator with XRE-family HTH domain
METSDVSTLKQLGKRIVYLRNALFLSQEALADLSFVNHTYLSELENGKRNVSVQILTRIAKALNITLSELFKGIDVF